jgi:hypothetical protein
MGLEAPWQDVTLAMEALMERRLFSDKAVLHVRLRKRKSPA